MNVKPVTSETLTDILLGRAGLIVGPGFTVHSDLYKLLSASMGHPNPDAVFSLRTLGDFLRSLGGDESNRREQFRDLYAQQSPSPYLPTLAKPNWKAVLSLSLDSHLESRIGIEQSKKPARRPLTVITELLNQVPPRCTPSFKLFGSLTNPMFALFEDECLVILGKLKY